MAVRQRKWTGPDGKERSHWVVDYVDADGKRRRKRYRTKKEADNQLHKIAVAVERGEHVPDSTSKTVKEAGELWLDTLEKRGLEWSTRDQCERHLRLHINPYLGGVKLTKLTLPRVRAFQDQLHEDGRSAIMVRRVTVSLGWLLGDAQERGLVAHNVVHEMPRTSNGARHKRKLQVGVDIPTRDEIRAILEAAEGRWRPLIVTAVFTGMRSSELRGLRWEDVDLEAGLIHVRQRADPRGMIGPPKSAAGQRTIPVPPMVVNTLNEWRLACPKGPLGLVFPSGKGNVESRSNIRQRGLIPTLQAAGLGRRYTRLHALRHFYASWCVNRKADGGLELLPKMVQERLGHETLAMTMDLYGHLFPRSDDAGELAAGEAALLGT